MSFAWSGRVGWRSWTLGHVQMRPSAKGACSPTWKRRPSGEKMVMCLRLRWGSSKGLGCEGRGRRRRRFARVCVSFSHSLSRHASERPSLQRAHRHTPPRLIINAPPRSPAAPCRPLRSLISPIISRSRATRHRGGLLLRAARVATKMSLCPPDRDRSVLSFVPCVSPHASPYCCCYRVAAEL